MNKRCVGDIIQRKLLGVFVFWPKAALATLALWSRLWPRGGGDRSFSGSCEHPEGKRKGCWKERGGYDSGKRSGGWHWFVLKSDTTLGSSGDSWDQPVCTVGMGVVLALETLGQEQRLELAVGETPSSCVTETRGDMNPTHPLPPCSHRRGPEETLGRTHAPVATENAITEIVGSDSDEKIQFLINACTS